MLGLYFKKWFGTAAGTLYGIKTLSKAASNNSICIRTNSQTLGIVVRYSI